MQEFDVVDPAAYGHWVEESVRFCDTDQAGHVNNVSIAAYAEAGRVGFAHTLVRPYAAPGEKSILAHIAIDYRRELHWPGKVRIGTRLRRIGNKSFALVTAIFRDGECIATAESIVANLRDSAAAPLSEGLRRRLEALLAEAAAAPR